MADDERVLLRYPLSWRSWRMRMVLGILVGVLMVRGVWGWQVGRVLRGQVDAARGRGEAVRVEEVKFEAVEDGENGWKVLEKAMQAHVAGVDSPHNSNDEYKEYPPFPDHWMKRAAASEQAHGQVFALSRQARGMTHVQIRDGVSSPLGKSFMLPGWNQARHLANTLNDGALYSHVRGDDAEAIERILDSMYLAESLRQDPFIISQLVATGVDALACNTTQIIGPGLRFGSGATTHPATAAQVRQLIARLLDERNMWRGFEGSLPMERMLTADFLNGSAHDCWLIRPLAEMEAVRINRNIDIGIQAGRLRSKSAADAVLARCRLEEDVDVSPLSIILGGKGAAQIPRYSRWFSIWSGDLSRNFEMQFQGIAERRMTAIALAAQLYRADHAAWPARLEDLVPGYLPAAPVDPYRGDGRPLGYVVRKGALADGGDRPLVYADAGVDHAALVTKKPMYVWYYSPVPGQGRLKVRQYRDLARFELARPSTQAVNNDPKKSDAPGK